MIPASSDRMVEQARRTQMATAITQDGAACWCSEAASANVRATALAIDETERPGWQAQLVAGYTVIFRIVDNLADHILADAENWWIRTLAYHQGTDDLALVHAAVAFLIQGGYLTRSPVPMTSPS